MELNVNIDHVATIRQARGGNDPDPIEAALISEKAGAKGIVCHLREDRRHIQDLDVHRLKAKVKSRLDLEMAAVEEIIVLAIDVMPNLVTIVPEKRKELTTEGGLDLVNDFNKLSDLCITMKSHNIPVSLFIEPTINDIELSKKLGADMVELHTGHYANMAGQSAELEAIKIEEACKYAKAIGLRIAAGHGLNYSNTSRIAQIHHIDELSIGHSIIARSVFVGIENAVKEMLHIIDKVKA